MILRNIQTQYLKLCELVVVILQKFLYGWSIEVSSTTGALDIIFSQKICHPWHSFGHGLDRLVDWAQKSSMELWRRQKFQNWLVHLVTLHDDWWKFDAVESFQPPSVVCLGPVPLVFTGHVFEIPSLSI